MAPNLTIETLKKAAKEFCDIESVSRNKELYGVTDGKKIGTHIEHEFQEYLKSKYTVEIGSSSKGIDLPGVNIQTDIKVTSIKKPQSSSPFKSAEQKIYGLGYNLLVFVYEKMDHNETKEAKLNFVSCIFIKKKRTSDYTTTFRLREMLADGANKDDVTAYLMERNLLVEESKIEEIVDKIFKNKPKQGYITVSIAPQWRLAYSRVVKLTDTIDGITKVVDKVTK